MRKPIILSFLLALTCLTSTSAQDYFGLPRKLDVATFAIDYNNNTCSPKAPVLHYSYNERDAFWNALHSNISSHYPSISSTWRAKYDEGQASLENFQNGSKDQCELVFFAGHGATDYNDAVFLNGTSCEYSENSFTLGGPNTKWAFFKACNVMYSQNPSSYQSILNGAHAMYGLRSLGYQWSIKSNDWICFWYGCKYSNSWDMQTFLFANWFAGQDMWTAYSNAMTSNMNGANSVQSGYIPGLDFAVVCPLGHAYDNNGYWTYLNGAQEQITNIFLNEMSPSGGNDWYPQGIVYWNTVLGTPHYTD